jgi:hypothetical protein
MKISMNALLPISFLTVVTLIGTTSCRRADEIRQLLSESEAAEIIETMIAERSGGVTNPIEVALISINAYRNNCGELGDTTFSRAKTTGLYTYDAAFTTSWKINCNSQGFPTDASSATSTNSNFTTPNWEGQETSSGNMAVTGLNSSASSYVANGSWNASSELTGDLRNVDPTITCTTVLKLDNVSYKKGTYSIEGGTGTAVITAKNGRGDEKILEAAITFNGNNTFTVKVNSFTYTFDLN